jgi:ABC-type uncharacterized transport system ATPase subunit
LTPISKSDSGGLDVQSRPNLTALLHSLHVSRNPWIILGLRQQDPIPPWVTHVALVNQGRVITGKKEDILVDNAALGVNEAISRDKNRTHGLGKVLVDLNNVGVKYGERQVRAKGLDIFF